jgi:zinc/manganese transport system substrate-binding protein
MTLVTTTAPRLLAVPLITALAISLAACSPTAPTDDSGLVSVVASTDVYGSIVSAIGGDLVAVTSLVTSAAQDPHSFEASAQNQLAISKADLIIENGGGYDPFVDTLLSAASSSAVVITAASVTHLAEGANEHLWYSFAAMHLVADDIASELGTLDPANATTYTANAEAFSAQLVTLTAALTGLGDGRSAAITEPVPLYLLDDAGFENITPVEFSQSIEEGTDVPPTVLRDTLNAIGDAALLAYNSQTASSETEQLRAAAEIAGVPVVEFTETLPDGEDYISWMTANVAAIAAAVA